GDIVLTDVVHEHRTKDSGRRPGFEQHSVDRAEITRAEHVFQVRRHGGATAAIHVDDYEEAANGPGYAADRTRVGHGTVEEEAERHEHEVGVPAPDIVRRGRPEETATHVEQAHQAHKAGGCDRRDMAREHFLAHSGSLSENADTGGHVEAQHPPDQPELWRLQCVVDEDVVLRDEPRCGCRG